MNDTVSYQQLVRRRLDQGAPCSLNPDEIAAVQALFEERDALQRLTDGRAEQRDSLLQDRDTWRRVAERLEREKISLAQDVLAGRDRRIAQAEALKRTADRLWKKSESLEEGPHRAGFADSAKIVEMQADQLARQAKGGD